VESKKNREEQSRETEVDEGDRGDVLFVLSDDPQYYIRVPFYTGNRPTG